MLIVCPSCATSYDVEPASLGANGRQVRCVRCRTVWRAEPDRATKLVAAAAALGSGAPALPDAPAIAAVATQEIVAAAGDDGWADPPPEAPPAERTAAAIAEAPTGAGEPAEAATVAAGPEAAATAEVEAPPLAPVDLDAGRPPIEIDGDRRAVRADDAAEDIESLAARRFPTRRRGLQIPSLSRLQALILVLLIVDAMVIGWRKDIVRLLPQTASLYASLGLPVNLRGLSFEGLATGLETHGGVPILVVHGRIVNVTGAITEVPRIKLVVRDAAKREIYSWTVAPPQARLPPYQSVDFTSRLASPPAGSHDVLIRFFNRRDLMAEGG